MNSVMDGMNSIMKEHLVRSLSQGLREDGRKHTEYREVSIDTVSQAPQKVQHVYA